MMLAVLHLSLPIPTYHILGLQILHGKVQCSATFPFQFANKHIKFFSLSKKRLKGAELFIGESARVNQPIATALKSDGTV